MVQGFPIFFTAMAQAHPVFFSEDNHKIRLILHHPGHRDGHEIAPLVSHQHDFLDRVIGVSKKGDFSHSDHEVEISASEDTFSTTKKTELVPDALSIFLADFPFRLRAQVTSFRFSGRAPPEISKFHDILSSTILLI